MEEKRRREEPKTELEKIALMEETSWRRKKIEGNLAIRGGWEC
jgi:hypothetical protein